MAERMQGVEKVVGIFDTAEEAIEAASRLRREGVPPAAINLISSEPLHIEQAESDERPRSHIPMFAVAGGLLGGAAAALLTVITSRTVDLVTGGMAIVTFWAFGIIVFEMTALGAILMTLARMIYEARLARRNSRAGYDEAVADGKIVVTVDGSSDAIAGVAENAPPN